MLLGFLSPWQHLREIKGGKINIGSWFQSFQSVLSWLLYCKLVVTQSIVIQECGSKQSGSPHSNQEAERHEGFRDKTPFKDMSSVTYFLQSVPSFPTSQYCHQIKLHWCIKPLAYELLEVFQSHWWGTYEHRGPQLATWNIYCWYLRPLSFTHMERRESWEALGPSPLPAPGVPQAGHLEHSTAVRGLLWCEAAPYVHVCCQ